MKLYQYQVNCPIKLYQYQLNWLYVTGSPPPCSSLPQLIGVILLLPLLGPFSIPNSIGQVMLGTFASKPGCSKPIQPFPQLNSGIAVGAMRYHTNYIFVHYVSFQKAFEGSSKAEYQCIWSIKQNHVKTAIPMQKKVTFVCSLSGSSSQQYGSLILHPW